MEAVGNKCEIRGCKSKAYRIHHIKPVSEGGTNVGSNLVVPSIEMGSSSLSLITTS